MSQDELADPRAEDRVGTVLADKWTLEKLLGLGGMGAVYAARHRNGARAAVKILHPELARNTEVSERFRREGYAANKVEHRSIVKVLDDDVIRDGPDEGAAYLVMELLEGESLDDRSDREPKLDEREILEVLDTVLDVLETAHAKGVVHRDLKPDNLFLAKDPDTGLVRVKVLDFGLARVADAARVTSHGLALGTPAFMSPEQAAGLPDIDGRADVFAIGATAYYVFTGQHIHEASTVLQQIIKMAKDQAPPLKSIVPGASDDFCAIIDRALQVDRDMRYPSAAAMHADVRAALERRAAWDERTLVAPKSIPPPSRSTNPPPSTAPYEEPRSRGSAFPLVSIMLLAILGLGGWMFWPRIKSGVHDLRYGATLMPTFAGADASTSAAAGDAGGPQAAATDASAAAVADLDADVDAAADGDTDAAADPDAAADLADPDGGVDLDDEEDDEEEEEDAGPAVDGGPTSAATAATPRRVVKKTPKHPGAVKKVHRKKRRRRHR